MIGSPVLAGLALLFAAAQPVMAADPAATAKMTVKKCGAQWTALSDAEKAKFNDAAKGQKSAKGGKLTGYNIYTKTVCFKKS